MADDPARDRPRPGGFHQRTKKRAEIVAAVIAALGEPIEEPPPEPPPAPEPRIPRPITPKIANGVWRKMSDVEKIKANYGMNLDQVRDLCSIDWCDADLHEKSLIVRIYEVHTRAGLSFARDKSRERETANLLRGVRETLEGSVMARRSAPASGTE